MAKMRAAKAKAAASQKNRQRRTRMMLMVGGAAIAVVIALIALGGILRSEDEPSARSAPASGLVLGSANAPVVIDAWEDFQCPVCKTANSSVVQQIEKNYVETGKAVIRYRQFPFLGQESYEAAEASMCANDQGKFWPYHDALFAAQSGENRGAFSSAKLTSIAESTGLDVTAFQACMASDSTLATITAEKSEGERLGVKGTPTFFVNGERLADWRSYDSFAALIEKALKSAEAR